MKNGTERPIGYVLRTLQEDERNYSTLEKEALATIFGIKKFHQFISVLPFVHYQDGS